MRGAAAPAAQALPAPADGGRRARRRARLRRDGRRSRRGSRRTPRRRPTSTHCSPIRRRSTCSGRTSSGATCSRGSSGARARRCRPASSRRCWRMVVAVPIGLVAGYYRGWVDAVIARVDRRAARVPVPDPRGRPRRDPRAVADATRRSRSGSPRCRGSIRVARGETLALREEDFVPAAVANGAERRDDHLPRTSSRT